MYLIFKHLRNMQKNKKNKNILGKNRSASSAVPQAIFYIIIIIYLFDYYVFMYFTLLRKRNIFCGTVRNF